MNSKDLKLIKNQLEAGNLNIQLKRKSEVRLIVLDLEIDTLNTKITVLNEATGEVFIIFGWDLKNWKIKDY